VLENPGQHKFVAFFRTPDDVNLDQLSNVMEAAGLLRGLQGTHVFVDILPLHDVVKQLLLEGVEEVVIVLTQVALDKKSLDEGTEAVEATVAVLQVGQSVGLVQGRLQNVCRGGSSYRCRLPSFVLGVHGHAVVCREAEVLGGR
jgi:hypothetical protein